MIMKTICFLKSLKTLKNNNKVESKSVVLDAIDLFWENIGKTWKLKLIWMKNQNLKHSNSLKVDEDSERDKCGSCDFCIIWISELKTTHDNTAIHKNEATEKNKMFSICSTI